MKIWILEDEPLQAEKLKKIIENHPECGDDSVLCLYSAEELKKKIGKDAPDILIADIVLGGEENGIELVKRFFDQPGIERLRSRTQVIYLTGYSEYCSDVYETEHIWFLLKPVKEEKLFRAIAIAKQNIKSIRDERLVIRVNGEVQTISPNEILYIESIKRKKVFCTTGGPVAVYMKAEELNSLLGDKFVQCHRSFFINMDHIRSTNHSEFIMTDGTKIPIGPLRRKAVKERYLKYLSISVQKG